MLAFTHSRADLRVLAPLRMLAVLAVALGFAYWLIPTQGELISRVIRDQETHRGAMTGLSALGTAEELSRLSASELATLTMLTRFTAQERMRYVFASRQQPPYHRLLHQLVLNDVRYVDVMSPAIAWPLVRDKATYIGSERYVQLADLLATNALAISNPKLAATILARACEEPESTASTAIAMSRAHRWASLPKQGAQHLRQWISQHSSTDSALRDEAVSLAHMSGDAGMALDILTEHWAADHLATSAELERAYALALQSTRTRELLPRIERLLHDSPNDETWRTRAAQVADWNGLFDQAFTAHLWLARHGKLASLDRCLALSDFLGRSEDTVAMLRDVGTVKDRPELPLRLAMMLGALGHEEEAAPMFKAWRDQHPQDRDAAFAYACLLDDGGDTKGAREAFAKLLGQHPHDVPTMKKLAELHIREDQFDAALQLYIALADDEHDAPSLENYELVAEAVEDMPHLFAAKLLRAELTGKVQSWIEATETAAALDDPETKTAPLAKALREHPDSAPLRVAMAGLLAAAQRPEDALELLLHPSVRGHVPATELLLGMEDTLRNREAVLAAIDPELETSHVLSAEAKLRLAALCMLAGHDARGERIFASIPRTDAMRVTIAQARFEGGQYDKAEAELRAYLKATASPSPDDYVLLGDIYDAMGRPDDARGAYERSLTLLTSDLTSRSRTTVAHPPAFEQPERP